jgi:LPS export ABC transporter protein LptC
MKFFCSVLIVLIIAGCGEEKVKPSIDFSLRGSKISAEGWNESVTFSDSGKTKAILYYNHLIRFDQPAETHMDTIKVQFFSSLGQISSVLTANKGKVNDATNDLYAKDNVVAVNDSGVTLKTQELMWRNKDKKIVSDKFVTIISPKEKIEGYGFESDQSLHNYTIYNITYVTRMDTTERKSPAKK